MNYKRVLNINLQPQSECFFFLRFLDSNGFFRSRSVTEKLINKRYKSVTIDYLNLPFAKSNDLKYGSIVNIDDR